MTSRRSGARIEALKALYMSEITGEYDKKEMSPFACEIVDGIRLHLNEIDEKIESFSENWKLFRMPIIDRCILRIACYEILYCPEIPGSVTINEAVELAKKFGGEDSGAFINGVLDRIAHETGKLPSRDDDEVQFYR